MRKTPIILLVLSLLAAGCASTPKSGQPSATDAATPDVLEAAFRYQLEQNATASPADRYCLELAGTSPAPELLRRFEGHKPPVLSLDQCKSQPGPGLYLRLTKIQWVTSGEAWLRGAVSDGSPTTPIVA